jgi:hypothetical protein
MRLDLKECGCFLLWAAHACWHLFLKNLLLVFLKSRTNKGTDEPTNVLSHFPKSTDIFLWKNTGFFFLWRCGPTRAMVSSVLTFMYHTYHITVGRTPLDEWSSRRRELNLAKHNTHSRRTSMPPAGLEPPLSAGEHFRLRDYYTYRNISK